MVDVEESAVQWLQQPAGSLMHVEALDPSKEAGPSCVGGPPFGWDS